MLKNLIEYLAAQPIVKSAALKIASEIAQHGVIGLIDLATDKAAYQVAKKIVEKEKQERKINDDIIWS
jgi:hypothetical protein